MTISREDIVAANRAGWNEAAPRHREHTFDKQLEAFRTPGYSLLDDTETAWLGDMAGRDVAQLCCNNGRELLSVKNLGAGRCVGFDLSDEFIAQARELAAAGAIDCDFVQGDIHRIPAAYDAAFHMVYVTIGALCWMPEPGPFFAVAARLLRPGGCVFVYEQHPIAGMLEPGETDDPPILRHSYFKADPWVDTDGLDYFGGGTYESKPLYNFQHKLSDIFAACLAGGLAIERFEEYSHSRNPQYHHLEKSPVKLPLSYALIARKAG